jgi:hypothetical protein
MTFAEWWELNDDGARSPGDCEAFARLAWVAMREQIAALADRVYAVYDVAGVDCEPEFKEFAPLVRAGVPNETAPPVGGA